MHHRAPSGVPCAILSLDGVLKVKIKLLETGGIRRLRAAARPAVSDGRYKQARSSRMPGCVLAYLPRVFYLSSYHADGQLLIVLYSLNSFGFFVPLSRQTFRVR